MSNSVHVAIAGFGFSGIYLSHLLKNVEGISSKAFETSDLPGGTWNWNRYPGARVDIVSRDYSFKFDKDLYQEWNWKELYAPQAELMDYVQHLVKRYKLEDRVQYRSVVSAAKWNEDAGNWSVTVQHEKEDGTKENQTWTAKYLVLATGCLTVPNLPDFPGVAEFKGEKYHTSRWPREKIDYAGKKVAVIGTGSSGIQTIPVVAEQAAHLHVFQRTANYSLPARNRKLTPEELAAAKEDSERLRKIGWSNSVGHGTFPMDDMKSWDESTPEEREARIKKVFDLGGLYLYGGFTDQFTNQECVDALGEFARKRIRSIVKDPKVAELLVPDFNIGCKRICADTNYYETYNRDNVTLVSIKGNPLKVVGGDDGKILLENGDSYGPFDMIIFATGFDAMTGAVSKIDITGRNGLTLTEAWKDGPVNYIGLFVSGFPNMFQVNGPGSPSVLTNMINGIEQHCEWIRDAIKKADSEGIKAIDATKEAETEWVDKVNHFGDVTIFSSCASWYNGSNIPGKKRQMLPFLGGFSDYIAICNDCLDNNFKGMELTKY